MPKYGIAFSRAQVGFVAGLSYEYEFKRSNFGAVVDIRTRSNVLDPGTGTYDDQNVAYSERKGRAQFLAALAGISYKKKLGSRWSLAGRLLAGGTKFSFGSTEQKYIGAPQPMGGFDGITEYVVDGRSGKGFTGVAALGPQFNLNRHFDVFVNVEYWYTRLHPIETTQYLYGYRFHVDNPFFDKNPSSFNLVAGLGFTF